MPLEFSKLTESQLKQLPPTQTVFFFPVGAIEDHGPHLPMDLDVVEANHICQELAALLERELKGWRAVLMPTAPLAVQSNTTHHALNVRAHVLRDWLVDACRSLSKAGFRHGVCVTGTIAPRQLTAIEEAGKLFLFRFRPNLFQNKFQLLSASSALIGFADVLRSPFWPDAPEHGGARDTSVALYLKTAVDGSYTQLAKRQKASGFMIRAWSRLLRRTGGYWGSPAESNSDRGKQEIQKTLALIWSRLKRIYDQNENPKSMFRTWYSVLPPNWGFFHAWLLIIGFFLCMTLWVWLF